jgi:hypothetical protein
MRLFEAPEPRPLRPVDSRTTGARALVTDERDRG